MNEKDRNAADDWIRDNMPDPAEYSFEDSEEAGSTESYFFLRHKDSATVVFKVAVKDGKVSSVLQEVYHGEGSQEEPDEQRWLVKRMARGVVRPFIWSGSLANALSSDSRERSTGEIGELKLAGRPGSRTADYLGFLDL